MAMEFSYGGVPLLFDQDMQVQKFLDKYQSLDDLVDQVEPTAITSGRTDNRSGNGQIVGLPVPNYPAPPKIRLNQLYWPTGAARWARGYFLANDEQMGDILDQNGMLDAGRVQASSLQLKVGDLSTAMSLLAPHAVGGTSGSTSLHMIPLVDARYFWQNRNFGSNFTTTGTSWATLIATLGTQLGVTISADTVDAAYLIPDPEELSRKYDNAAEMLDAVAHSVGMRVVRLLDGTVKLMDWSSSASKMTANNQRTAGTTVAGGEVLPTPAPATVDFVCQKSIEGVAIPDEVHQYSKSPSSTTVTSSGTAHAIHSTAYADFSGVTVTPTNNSDLNTLAIKSAADFYSSIDKSYEFTYQDIDVWEPQGYDDHILYNFGGESPHSELKATTYVVGTEAVGIEATTKLTERRERCLWTRIQSAPANFGTEQQLSQDSSVTPLHHYQFGKINEASGIGNEAKGTMDVWVSNDPDDPADTTSLVSSPLIALEVYNFLPDTLDDGTEVFAWFNYKSKRWYAAAMGSGDDDAKIGKVNEDPSGIAAISGVTMTVGTIDVYTATGGTLVITSGPLVTKEAYNASDSLLAHDTLVLCHKESESGVWIAVDLNPAKTPITDNIIPKGTGTDIEDSGWSISDLDGMFATVTETINDGFAIDSTTITTGGLIKALSDAITTDTRDLVSFINDNVASTGCTVLYIRQDANQEAVYIEANNTTTEALTVRANALTTGAAARFYSTSDSSSIRNLVEIVNDNPLADGATCLRIQQDGNNDSIEIVSENTTAGNSVNIFNPKNTSSDVLYIDSCDGLTDGSAARFHSNSASSASRHVVEIINDHNDSSGATALFVQQDSLADAVSISTTNNSTSLLVTSSAAAVDVISALDGSTSIGTMISLACTSEAITTGQIISGTLVSSGNDIEAKTGSLNTLSSDRTETRTTLSTDDDFDNLLISRNSVMNGAGGAMSSLGSLLKIEKTFTETLGTLTDTAVGIEIVLNSSASSGEHYAIVITHDVTGIGIPGGIDMSSYAADEPVLKVLADGHGAADFGTEGHFSVSINGAVGKVPVFDDAVPFAVPIATSPVGSENGAMAWDSAVTLFQAGVLKYFGVENMGIVAMPAANFESSYLTTPTSKDGFHVAYSNSLNGFELVEGGGTFTAAGDTGGGQLISGGDTLSILGGNGIGTIDSITDTVTVSIDDSVAQSIALSGSGASGTNPVLIDAHVTGNTFELIAGSGVTLVGGAAGTITIAATGVTAITDNIIPKGTGATIEDSGWTCLDSNALSATVTGAASIGISLSADAITTGKGVDVSVDGLTTGTGIEVSTNALSTGRALYVHSSSATAGTRTLAEFENTGGADATCLTVTQSAAHRGLFVDQSGAGNGVYVISSDTNSGVYIDQEVASTASDVYGLKIDCDITAGGGLPGGIDLSSFSEDEPVLGLLDDGAAASDFGTEGHFAVKVGATVGWVPVFSESTPFAVPIAGTPGGSENGAMSWDSTVTEFDGGILKYWGVESMGLVAMPAANFAAAYLAGKDGYHVAYNDGNNEFELVAGGGTTAITDNIIPKGTGASIEDSGWTCLDSNALSATVTGAASTGISLTTSGVTTGDGIALTADSITTGSAIFITADGLTTGSGLQVISTSAEAATRTLVEIDNAGGGATALSVSQGANNDAILVSQTGEATGVQITQGALADVSLNITQDSNSALTIYAIAISNDNAHVSGDPGGIDMSTFGGGEPLLAAPAHGGGIADFGSEGHVAVEIGGADGFVPVFNATHPFNIPVAAAPEMSVDGDVGIDSSMTDLVNGAIAFRVGSVNRFCVPLTEADLSTATDQDVVTYDTVNNLFELKAQTGGGSFTSFIAAGDSGGGQTITDGNTLSILGGSGIDTVDSATDTVTISSHGFYAKSLQDSKDTTSFTANFVELYTGGTLGAAVTVRILTGVNGGTNIRIGQVVPIVKGPDGEWSTSSGADDKINTVKAFVGNVADIAPGWSRLASANDQFLRGAPGGTTTAVGLAVNQGSNTVTVPAHVDHSHQMSTTPNGDPTAGSGPTVRSSCSTGVKLVSDCTQIAPSGVLQHDSVNTVPAHDEVFWIIRDTS